ncbi:MAG: phosphatidylserine decarboxylase [Verrucomicrobia bacterium]|nr:phosphatidylserine decarboxylase [Verrucomicrobiota bacterium]
MKNVIRYIERKTGEELTEKVYGQKALEFAYGEGLLSKILLPLTCRLSFSSKLYSYFQKSPKSRGKVRPFIETYGVDEKEFADRVETFGSFNEFFVRKLKSSCRPIEPNLKRAVLPADARYLVYPDLEKVDGFYIKGQKFSLSRFLDSPILARRFYNGSMVIARLCPSDYHRFHFPCDGVPSKPKRIDGPLFSVNPIALRKNLSILWQNKRFVTEIDSEEFGTVLYVEVGATMVGSVQQTFSPNHPVRKGDEKGYFQFGGSCVVLLFEKGKIQFDGDLIENSNRFIETRANYGESLGRAPQL